MLERFEIIKKLGQGGMAEVFLAYLHGYYGFKKEVVIKKILNEHFDNEKFLRMFVDEASVSALLNHSNIVQVYDFFQERNVVHLVMEYINGNDLRELINYHYTNDLYIPVEHVLYIVNELLNGMNFYHNKRDISGKILNIIHRDLTPKNILLSIYGDVKISDFGIARFEDKLEVTTFGEIKGKPSYLSPEQLKLSPDLDCRVDLFALGVIFYELLTNKHPFKEKSQAQTQQNILRGIYPELASFRQIPNDVAKIVKKLLEIDRDKRYRNARDAKKDLLVLNYQISNQLSFSQFLTKTLFPESHTYVESIAPSVETKSDYRFFKPTKSNKMIMVGIGVVLLINIFIVIIASISPKAKEDIKLTINHTKEIPGEYYGKVEIEKVKEEQTNDIVFDEDVIKNDENNLNNEKKKETVTTGFNTLTETEDKNNKANLNKNTTVQKKDENAFGTIDIHIIPYGKIYIDGKLVSEVSLKNHKITAGKHKLEIKNDDFNYLKSQTITIEPNENSSFYFNTGE